MAEPASEYTRSANGTFADGLPMDDRTDFERAEAGLVATSDSLVVEHDAGHRNVWDMDQYAFITESEAAPDTVNPSLWRQARLNTRHGLYRVTDRIHQVRGYDISNLTVIEGETGWIVIDPLTATETARAAMALVNEHLGERPVQAVIYTHSHGDHFAGVLGVASREELAEREIPIIAPEGFLKEAVFETVIAGNAMIRRAMYMYGGILPTGPTGQVDCGLGKVVPAGSTALVAPTHEISATGEEMVLDGVRVVFQYTPDAEAPAEMMFHFPELRALCLAENCTSNMHNLYTPRGAQVRDTLAWSKYIGEAIELFAEDSDVSFASHHWPYFGQDDVRAHLETQRDTYRFLHDQTMRLANHGETPIEIAEQLDLPDGLAAVFANRGYYGTVNHNAKAVYQRYLGWFDGNPANLHPHPPAERGRRYVDAFGGADALLTAARGAFEDGDYRWVVELVNHLVFADPDNDDARSLQADALEQLGYQAESGPWRNFYLAGAKELREGTMSVGLNRPAGQADMLGAMPMDMIFDLLGVRLDGVSAQHERLSIGWDLTDRNEQWTLGLQHGAIHYVPRLKDDTDAVLRLPRSLFDQVLAQIVTFEDAMATGDIEVEGDAGALLTFFGYLDEFDPVFPIVTP